MSGPLVLREVQKPPDAIRPVCEAYPKMSIVSPMVGVRPFLVPLFVFSMVPYHASFGEQEAVATVRSES